MGFLQYIVHKLELQSTINQPYNHVYDLSLTSMVLNNLKFHKKCIFIKMIENETIQNLQFSLLDQRLLIYSPILCHDA